MVVCENCVDRFNCASSDKLREECVFMTEDHGEDEYIHQWLKAYEKEDPDLLNMLPKEEEQADRFNEGKVDYSKLPLDLLDGTSRVMAKGAIKYSKNNYRKGYKDLDSPLASILRHITKLQQAINNDDIFGFQGHLMDEESEEAHIHHAIAGLVIMVNAMRIKGYKV